MSKDKLINLIQDNKKQYASIIQERINNFSYRSQRYGHVFSLSVALCEKGIDLRGYCDYKRQSDVFIVLENNLCCLILDCTDANSGVKAANNMLTSFQSHNFSKTLYSSIISSDEYPESERMINELFYVLKYAIENNMDNIVVDAHSMFKD